MTVSAWNNFVLPKYLPLRTNLNTDCCVVGGGIGGITTAYLLARLGREVVLLNDGPFGNGETRGSTAQINNIHDDGWEEMESLHGTENMLLCVRGYDAARKFIESSVRELQIDCGFETLTSYLFPRNQSKEARDELLKDYEAAKRIGLENVNLVAELEILNFKKGPVVCYSNQAQFHPLRYLNGLLNALTHYPNAKIFADSRVTDVHDQRDSVTLKLSNRLMVSANKVVLATNVPQHHKLFPHEAMTGYRSYVVAFPIKKGSVPMAQYWDMEDPYHYARVIRSSDLTDGTEADKQDLLLVGGEDHRVGDYIKQNHCFDRLIRWSEERFPIVSKPVFSWSAQTVETFDGMPLLGLSPGDHQNVYVITGDSGTGITHATLGALINSDLIAGKKSPWERIFSPSRSRLHGLKRWLKQNAENATEYRDWLTPGDRPSEDKIPPGTGAIVRSGLDKIAVYKDESGEVTKFHAACPHLGGVVRWNEVEQSWDCPVHGSRFDKNGNCLNGPAHCGLKKYQVAEANREHSEDRREDSSDINLRVS